MTFAQTALSRSTNFICCF